MRPLTLILCALMACPMQTLFAAPPTTVEVTVSAEVSQPSTAKVTARRGEVTVEINGRSITLDKRQQRDMGLTRAEVRRTLREMRRDGFQGDKTEVALEIQDRLYDAHPEAWEAVAQQNGVMSTGSGENVAIDWDGLLAFLEALIPIIEKLLEIFSSFSFAAVDAPTWYTVAGCSLHLAA